MIAPAPVLPLPEGRLRLDAKFVEGMRLHVAQWRARGGGALRVILWRGGAIPFGDELDPAELDFELVVLDPDQPIGAGHVRGAALVFASADMQQTLDLPAMARQAGARLVYAVEYTLETRLQILRLEDGRSLPRKLRSALWLLAQERRRCRAFRRAQGVQANGWPAEAAYRGLAPDMVMYVDGRMRADMMATPAEMRARSEYLGSGGPLRIAHSGRLEPMKGAQDLLPLARRLLQLGVDFTLDIWGSGSLGNQIAQGIATGDLAGRVRLHDPVPFETGLVPALRGGADLFLSCHRQADPSCSYIEAMGCGIPVAGYDNRMWRALSQAARSGSVAPLGNVAALAATVASRAADRPALIADGAAALAYARAHDFQTEFARRMDQLARIAGLSDTGLSG